MAEIQGHGAGREETAQENRGPEKADQERRSYG